MHAVKCVPVTVGVPRRLDLPQPPVPFRTRGIEAWLVALKGPGSVWSWFVPYWVDPCPATGRGRLS